MRGKMFSVLLVLALLSLSVVSAQNVRRWTVEYKAHWTLYANTDENPCDFDIEESYVGTGMFLGWFDEEGNRIRWNEVEARVDQAFSANGKTIKIHSSTIHYTQIAPDKLLITFLGESGFATVPGYGQVWGGAGQGSIIFQYDPESDEWIEVEWLKDVGVSSYDDFSPICEYLAP